MCNSFVVTIRHDKFDFVVGVLRHTYLFLNSFMLFTVNLEDLLFFLSFVTSKRNIGQCTGHIFNQSMFREKLVATCFVSLVSECLDYLISPTLPNI